MLAVLHGSITLGRFACTGRFKGVHLLTQGGDATGFFKLLCQIRQPALPPQKCCGGLNDITALCGQWRERLHDIQQQA